MSRNRLHVNRLVSIGAVEAGDNPEADILFWKSQPHDSEPEQPETTEVSVPDIDTLDDAKARISELEEKLAAFDDVEPSPLPEDLPEPVAKRLSEMDETIAKEREEKERLSKEIADLRDERATEKYTKRAEELAVILGKPEETAPILKALATADEEAFEKLDERLSNLVRLDGFEMLLKEHGDSAAEGSAMDQIAAISAEIRKEDPNMTPAEARAEAWRRNPDLKAQARQEGV